MPRIVRGALLHMMGRSDVELPLLRAKSDAPMRKKPGRTEFQRGILERKNGEWSVRSTGAQGSGILRSMVAADGLAVVPGDTTVEAGGTIPVILLREVR